MKRVFLILFAAFLLFSAGEWLYRAGYGPHSSAQAYAPPPVSPRQLSDAEAVPLQDIPNPTNKLSSEAQSKVDEQSPQIDGKTAPSLNRFGETIVSDPVIDHFRSLYTEFANQYITPGWLHFSYREEHPAAQSGPEYAGITIPATFVFDTWYRLDASLNVIEGVTLMVDEAGQIVQVSVYSDRVWRNLTIDEEMAVEQPLTVRLDSRFLFQLEEVVSSGGEVTEEAVTVNGRNLTRFGLEERFDSPIVLSSLATPMQAARRFAYFDPMSGHLVMFETIFTTLDGQDIVTLRTTLQVIENTNPPAEILTFLEAIK